MTDLKGSIALWLVITLVFCVAEARSIRVSTNCLNTTDEVCVDIDGALQNLQNRTVLYLEPGIHAVQEYHFNSTWGTVNVSLIGSGLQETTVECEDDHGLAFLYAKNLFLANFTISGCGLSDEELEMSVTSLKKVIDLFFYIPLTTQIALFLGNCEDVAIQDLHITNTTGLGLLGINVMGNSTLNQVSFTQNAQPECNVTKPIIPSLITPETYDQVGGGAYFLYTDYYNPTEPIDNVRLLLQNAYFAHNADCTYAAFTNMNYHYFTRNGSGLYEYGIGAGGGLSIVVASSHSFISVTIVNSEFFQNDARYGGGAYVAIFAGFLKKIEISFDNCTFHQNGLSSMTGERTSNSSLTNGGAGMAIFADLVKPKHLIEPIPSVRSILVVVIRNSNFFNNIAAYQGGGLMVYSLFHTPQSTLNNMDWLYYRIGIVIVGTNFTENRARYNSAACFKQLAANGFRGSAVLTLIGVNILRNGVDASFADLDEAASALQLSSFFCVIHKVKFADNMGSALRLESTVCNIRPGSSLVFMRNKARRGGALHMSGHPIGISLEKSSSMEFIDNEAIIEGGAIYFAAQIDEGALRTLNYVNCYIGTSALGHLENPDGNFMLFGQNISLSFKRNRAPLGSIVFGTSLETCPWARNVSRIENLNLYQTLSRGNRTLFNFDDEPVNETMVSSLPASLEIVPPPELYPGNSAPINITVFDAFRNVIPALVTCDINDTMNVSARPTLGNSGLWYTSGKSGTLSVYGTYRGSLEVTILESSTSLSYDISVDILNCPIGFVLGVNYQCICDSRLSNVSGLECFDNSLTLRTSDDTWVGFDGEVNATTDNLVVHRCILTYCASFFGSNNTDLSPSNFDIPCAKNRIGFLCSECDNSTSHAFGSDECSDKCSEFHLLLIPVFAFAGVAFLVLIVSLKVTIDKGLPNVIWFSACTLSCFLLFFVRSIDYPVFLLPLRLWVLQLGITTCFYPGMTVPQRSLILLLFPLYMFILVGIAALLCKVSNWLRERLYPAKILASMLFWCYFSVLSTCHSIIAPIKVRTIGGEEYYAWRLAPSISYTSTFHIILTALALAITCCYLIPFPVLLLFPRLVSKCGENTSLFFNIAWGSLKPKFRFWQGIRLVVIIVLFLISQFPSGYASIASGVVIVSFLGVETVILPFRSNLANYFDIALVIITGIAYWNHETLVEENYSQGLFIVATIYEVGLIGSGYILHFAMYGILIRRHFGGSFFKKVYHLRKNGIAARAKQIQDMATEQNGEDVTLERVVGVPYSSASLLISRSQTVQRNYNIADTEL